MATIFALSAANDTYSQESFQCFVKSASQDVFKVHKLVQEPAQADIILFIERTGQGSYQEYVRNHPVYERYAQKCFIFDQNPLPIGFLRGVYTSIEKCYYQLERYRSGFYLANNENRPSQFIPIDGNEKYLFSFVGSVITSPLRQGVMQLDTSHAFLMDTSTDNLRIWSSGTDQERDQVWRQYREVIYHSKFVLCPRGLGPNSIRLFEAMKMGRVPVIISDGWVPPAGPSWNTFSVRVPEAEVACIPGLLKSFESSAGEMGHLAHQAWQDWFSEQVCFHRIVEWCLDIQHNQIWPEALMRRAIFLQLIRPFHFKNYLRIQYKRWKEERTFVW